MIKPPLLKYCSVIALLVATAPVYAGQQASSTAPNSVQGMAEREITRRNEQVARAQQAIDAGDKAMKVRDYETAVAQYKAAADILVDSPVTHKLRDAAVERYCIASVKLAEVQIAEGKFAQAEATAKAVLAPAYNPHCHGAKTLLARLADPGYYNKAITPAFHDKVEKVKQWFVEAQDFYDTAQYDKAMQRCDMILGVDKTNVAAREMQIKVDQKRTEFADESYKESRARALWKVADAWGQPIRRYGKDQAKVLSAPVITSSSIEIQNKLNRIRIPKVEFNNASIREVIDFLKKRSVDLDPDHKGVNIVLQLDSPSGVPTPVPTAGTPPAEGAAPAIPGAETPAATAATPAPTVAPGSVPITLSLTDVPLAEVLRYVSGMAGLKVKIDAYAVNVVPITTFNDTLITKEYKIPPGTLTANSASGTTAPAAAATAPAAGPATTRVPAKDYFSQFGVLFPPGSSAIYLPAGSRLIVRNTQEQLDLIDTYVEAMNGQVPLQVDIEAKFVEISQTNLKELSFQTSVGNFNFGPRGSGQPYGIGGGTLGGLPFVDGGNAAVTGGLRSGVGTGQAISTNAIDSLLFPNNTASNTPIIMSASGVFSGFQFQTMMKALDQKKGVDLLSSPRVTCKSGQEATIEVIRKFIYPDTFTPPTVSTGSAGNAAVATPTTPASFKTEPVGVLLAVTPTVGADGSTIDMSLEPKVTEFEGFINYGTPIMGTGLVYDPVNGWHRIALTDNVINQPIFSSRRVKTQVSVWDGQTVMLGGLMREDVQKVEDKVPFFGDIPLIGRAFRSSVDQHQKKSLIIFVSAHLINPAGDPVNATADENDEAADISVKGALPSAESMLTPPMPTK